jgi:hypothetical protein
MKESSHKDKLRLSHSASRRLEELLKPYTRAGLRFLKTNGRLLLPAKRSAR